MKLATVKVLSQNKDIRGKVFDVYYIESHGEIELVSVENLLDVKNLLSTFDEQSINDITASLKDLIISRNIKTLNESFTEFEKDIGFAQDADANNSKGHLND
jgi:hypothetical protein